MIDKTSQIPKDRQIVINTKYGNYVAMWSGADNKFVYANPTIDLYEGKWDMAYFENEYIKKEEIISWRDL